MSSFARNAIFYFLTLAFSALSWPSLQGATVEIQLDTELQYGAIDELLQTPKNLGKLTFESDVPFDSDEFYYLVDAKPGQLVTAQTVKQAIAYLAKKRTFRSVKLTTTDQSNDVVDLHMAFTGLLIFKKLIINNVSRGRDLYRGLYHMEQGEIFDEKKHHYSLQKIEQFLREQGYVHGQARAVVEHDQATKSVTVTLYIMRGTRYRIGNVHLQIKNQYVHQRTLLIDSLNKLLIKKLEGKSYTQLLLNKFGKELKRFLIKKGYHQVSITLKERELKNHAGHKHLVELDLILDLHSQKRFVFFGNHYLSDQQLLDIILPYGQLSLILPAALLAEEMQRAYQKKGFWQAEVEGREEDDHYLFVVKEGSRACVQAVQIKGVAAFQVQELCVQFFSDTINHFFDTDQCKQSLDTLIAFYHAQGFWDATIVDHLLVPSVSSGLKTDMTQLHSSPVSLVVHIDEGKRYYLSSLSIEQFPDLEQQEPFMLYKNIKQPTPFDDEQIALQRRWLTDYFRKQGYLYVEVKPELAMTDGQDPHDGGSARFITLGWHIQLHEKVRFGKTIVNNTGNIPFRYIERSLHYKEGDQWNGQYIERSFAQLRDLGLFDTVHIYPEHSTEPEPYKPVMLKLVEDDPFEIRVRAGVLGVSKNLTWREGATYKVGGSFVAKNCFNRGGQLRFDGDLTLFERYASLYYTSPWLFGLPYKTLVKGYSNKFTQPVMVGKSEPLYVATQQGFLVGVSYKNEGLTFGINIGVEWMETSVKNDTAARAINFSPALVDVKIPYAYLEPTLVLDYLDDKLNPTFGAFTVCSCKGMFPFTKTLPFFKILFEQSFFCPLYHALVGAFRIRLGHVFNQKFNQIMPPERFYLGGAYSVRGYQPDFAPPLGCFVDNSSGKKQFVPQGGRSMVNANIELRFPIKNAFSGAIFQDFGLLVGDEFVDVEKGMVAATGAGVRYNTPIGPLRFDVGVRWKKSLPSDSRIVWFFTLGNAF